MLAPTNIADDPPPEVVQEFEAALEAEGQAYEDHLRQALMSDQLTDRQRAADGAAYAHRREMQDQLLALPLQDEIDDELSLNDYRLGLAVLDLAQKGEPCIDPEDPRPICKAWRARQRAKEKGKVGPASNTQARQKREKRAAGKQPPPAPLRPSAQARRAEWEKARAEAEARAKREPPPFTEPQPGEAGYVPVDEEAAAKQAERAAAGAIDEKSLTTPRKVTATWQKPVGQTDAHHVNEAWHIKDAEGHELFFKPISGEKRYIHAREIGMHASLAEREVVSARIDKALGLNLVLPTYMAEVTMRGGQKELGMVHDWVDAHQGRTGPRPSNAEVARLGILHAVLGNLDGHGNNFMIGKSGALKGKLIAIDHGYALGDSPIACRPRVNGGQRCSVPVMRSWALPAIQAGALSAVEQRALADKLDHMPWQDVLAGSHLNKADRDSLFQRAKVVSDYLRRGQIHRLNEEQFNADPW